MIDFWKPQIPIEFSVDASLDDCLERLENYYHGWLQPLSKRISTIKDGEIYEAWLQDSSGFASLSIRLEKSGENTFISGTANYMFVMLVLIIVFSVTIFASVFAIYQPDLIVLVCPTIFFGWVWFCLIISRHNLLRRVKKILGYSPKAKLH
jgi:hypothetical protein